MNVPLSRLPERPLIIGQFRKGGRFNWRPKRSCHTLIITWQCDAQLDTVASKEVWVLRVFGLAPAKVY